MKFKSDIEVQAGLKDSSGAVGTSGQVLSSTASGVSWITQSISGYVPYTGATANVNLGAYSITADSFIKIGGTADQYLKADGSVSTAMNSRVEADFVATSGQTTFVTPYEVGQIDVYYNGSKLYPNEFTATNGTDVILATGATLNAQISIVKYVSSLSTTAIRNETTFTTTAGQTTFAVNYSPGQVDVFYNGSKLNISEFTATNGTSVVLGFACAAGESIVIDSYVNQISGASGTANKVAKFTGAASLGNSQIDDNGTNVSVGYTTNPNAYKLDVNGKLNWGLNSLLTSGGYKVGYRNSTVNIAFSGSSNWQINNDADSVALMTVLNGGNVGIGTTSPGTTTNNTLLGFVNGSNIQARTAVPQIAMSANIDGDWYDPTYKTSNYAAQIYADGNRGTIALRTAASGTAGNAITWNTPAIYITNGGNVGIGTTSPAKKLHVKGGNDDVLFLDNGGERYTTQYFANNGTTKSFLVWDNTSSLFEIGTAASSDLRLLTNNAERMRITSGGNLLIGQTTDYGQKLQLNGCLFFNQTADRSNGVEGTYDPTRLAAIWSMGGSYKLASSGYSGGSLYGLNYSFEPNYGGAGNNPGAITGLSHQMQWRINGGTATAIGNGVWTAGSVTQNSDIRIKTNIERIDNALHRVSQINGYTFDRTDLKVYHPDGDKPLRQTGVVAQEILNVLPEAVTGSEETLYSVDYGSLAGLFIEAIKEQQAQIQELKAEIEILKNK